MKTAYLSVVMATCCTVIISQSAAASVIIQGTRVVYPADQKEVSVRIFNKDTKPSLVQAWIDDGDATSTPDKVKGIPFTLTPPVFRMESDKGQVLRMAFTEEKKLASDRETLYWLNVLDVPPQAKNKETNSLQFAFRTRIKVFYRPAGLKGKASEAAQALTWKSKTVAGKTVLVAQNPTPYFVSLNAVYSGPGDKGKGDAASGMIAPFSSRDYRLPGNSVITSQVSYSSINDYGATEEHKKVIQK